MAVIKLTSSPLCKYFYQISLRIKRAAYYTHVSMRLFWSFNFLPVLSYMITTSALTYWVHHSCDNRTIPVGQRAKNAPKTSDFNWAITEAISIGKLTRDVLKNNRRIPSTRFQFELVFKTTIENENFYNKVLCEYTFFY